MAKQSLRILSIAILTFVFGIAQAADSAIGTWKTESSKKGYLHVVIAQCEEKLCGTILQAYDTEDAVIADYEHIGKQMVWNMKSKTDTSWTKGKIWDPSEDKTYKSKMSVSGDVLSVSGCVLVFCKSQKWARVAE